MEFVYKVRDNQGRVSEAYAQAESASVLKIRLQARGVDVIDIKERTRPQTIRLDAQESLDKVVALFEQITLKDMVVFSRQFAALVGSGVSMLRTLYIIVDQCPNKKLKRAIDDVRRLVESGLSLSDAMTRQGGIFDSLYISMVRAGEAGGILSEVLKRLADFLESQNKLRAKVMSAMMYPIIMTVLAVGILTLLMTTVVPKVTAIFADTGRALPLNTQILIFISTLVSDYLWLLLIIGIGSFVAFRRWVSTPKGRLSWDTFKLRVPVLGGLERKVAVSRFAKTLSTMLASGVQLLRAMEIVKNVLGNTVLMNVIEQARESIREGESIAAPLKRSGQFPAIVCHMIAVGERSGQLEQMLENVSGAYDLEVETQLERLTALLSPLMILGMGGAVFFVVTSIMLPIMQMNDFVQ